MQNKSPSHLAGEKGITAIETEKPFLSDAPFLGRLVTKPLSIAHLLSLELKQLF
nr:hypothetical protein [uncultured Solibaculum sp.]